MESGNLQREDNLTIFHPKHHKHTIIWIHGLAQHQQMHLNNLLNALGKHTDTVKIVCPRAPERFVTLLGSTASSWYNTVHRNETNFIVPFDEAFSSEEVHDSHQRILLPIIKRQSKIVKELGGKLIVSGFSQGCGMSIHCLYSNPELVDAAISISGYFFPITKYDPKVKNPLFLIYGLEDNLRPWQLSKVTFYGRMSEKQMTFIPGVKHEFTKAVEEAYTPLIDQILGVPSKL